MESSGAPNWGIEPVPDRLRVFGLVDTGLLWANLGVSLLVLVAGALLVPALSQPAAIVAVVVGAVVYRLVIAAALFVGLGPTDMRLVTSVIVIAALAVPRLRGAIGLRGVATGTERVARA